jgi:hypothetical protein
MDGTVRQEVSGKAVASLALGVISFFALPLVGGLLAIIFGSLAKSEIRNSSHLTGEGYATAGLILGIVNLVGSALMFLLFLSLTVSTVQISGG